MLPLPSLLLLLLATSGPEWSSAAALREAPAGGFSLENLDPTLPPALPSKTPDCSVNVLQQDFAGDVGSSPATGTFTQPEACPAPWTRVVLELSVSASDVNDNRIAGVWIDGAEVLRTTTPLTVTTGVFWRVHKDITRYTALLRRLGSTGGVISMMLDNNNNNNNSPDAPLPGSYIANVSLHFYRGWIAGPMRGHYTAHPTVKGLYRRPADLIIPVSQYNGNNNSSSGYWFQISDRTHVPTALVGIPSNTYRAVLEIFSSYHADDEQWYTNPLRNSFDGARLGDGKTNGGYRQVYATIDGRFVGGHIPVPVIYPGSINPYFWSPVAALGAFDLPSYDLDVTPFLALLLDGKPHEIGLGVRDSNPYWLLTGNLHIWVDEWSNTVEAGVIEYTAPEPAMNRHAEWRSGDGSSEVDAEGQARFRGWVRSSRGNLTTEVRQKVSFKSQVAVQNRGAVRQVDVVNKEETTVGVYRRNQMVRRVQVFVESPVQVQTSSVRAAGGAVYEKTRLNHRLLETVIVSENQGVSTVQLTDRQEAEGAVMLRDGVTIWGNGATKSSYKYTDDSMCYARTVNTEGGIVKVDATIPTCTKRIPTLDEKRGDVV